MISVPHIDEKTRREFAERGVVRIAGLIPEAAIAPNRERVYSILEDAGVWQDGRWVVDDERGENRTPGKFHWLAPTKYLPMRRIRDCAKSTAFRAMFLSDALAAAKELAGERLCTSKPPASGAADAFSRPQLLFTPPGADHWFVPNTIWHLDVPRLGEAGAPGVQVFILLDDIPPGGGATLVVAGSHRLLNDRVRRSKDVKKALKRRPYFQHLMGPRPQDRNPSDGSHIDPDSARLLNQPGHDGDIPLQVVEMDGKAGDAYITDLRLLHTLAPNASPRPRLMATQRLPYPDIVGKLDDAHAELGRKRKRNGAAPSSPASAP
ncbi:MAG: phytanoyl-CoA dioxygenase family protein [Gammaproteobacteria bacterium]|nr:phytanoyl-CoA dioxygenase family protein [Gammaproteobacteria bacterium]MYB35784.1 phytanoyl-CoA dioxygenase family protein [Gammaproteobacteria bacterium]